MHFNSRRIPKIELHIHLDTCISYHCAKMLMPALNLKVFQSNFIAPSQCTDLGDFLRRISPFKGFSNPIMARSSVLFPVPLRPNNAISWLPAI